MLLLNCMEDFIVPYRFNELKAKYEEGQPQINQIISGPLVGIKAASPSWIGTGTRSTALLTLLYKYNPFPYVQGVTGGGHL